MGGPEPTSGKGFTAAFAGFPCWDGFFLAEDEDNGRSKKISRLSFSEISVAQPPLNGL